MKTDSQDTKIALSGQGLLAKCASLLIALLTIWLISKGQDKIAGLFDWKWIENKGIGYMALGLVGLMLLNWYLEALKFKRICLGVYVISWKEALEFIFIGLFAGSITPNRIGDWLGRLAFIQAEKRNLIFHQQLFLSAIQTIITLVLGIAACLFFPFDTIAQAVPLLSFTRIASVLGAAALLVLAACTFSITRLWMKTRLQYVLQVAAQIRRPILAELFTYALLRYLVFSIQFYVTLTLLGLTLNLHESLLVIPLYFFFFTLIPTWAVTELPVRALVAMVIFDSIHPGTGTIASAAALLLWFVNLFIPSLLGGILALRRTLAGKQTPYSC